MNITSLKSALDSQIEKGQSLFTSEQLTQLDLDCLNRIAEILFPNPAQLNLTTDATSSDIVIDGNTLTVNGKILGIYDSQSNPPENNAVFTFTQPPVTTENPDPQVDAVSLTATIDDYSIESISDFGLITSETSFIFGVVTSGVHPFDKVHVTAQATAKNISGSEEILTIKVDSSSQPDFSFDPLQKLGLGSFSNYFFTFDVHRLTSYSSSESPFYSYYANLIVGGDVLLPKLASPLTLTVTVPIAAGVYMPTPPPSKISDNDHLSALPLISGLWVAQVSGNVEVGFENLVDLLAGSKSTLFPESFVQLATFTFNGFKVGFNPFPPEKSPVISYIELQIGHASWSISETPSITLEQVNALVFIQSPFTPFRQVFPRIEGSVAFGESNHLNFYLEPQGDGDWEILVSGEFWVPKLSDFSEYLSFIAPGDLSDLPSFSAEGTQPLSNMDNINIQRLALVFNPTASSGQKIKSYDFSLKSDTFLWEFLKIGDLVFSVRYPHVALEKDLISGEITSASIGGIFTINDTWFSLDTTKDASGWVVTAGLANASTIELGQLLADIGLEELQDFSNPKITQADFAYDFSQSQYSFQIKIEDVLQIESFLGLPIDFSIESVSGELIKVTSTEKKSFAVEGQCDLNGIPFMVRYEYSDIADPTIQSFILTMPSYGFWGKVSKSGDVAVAQITLKYISLGEILGLLVKAATGGRDIGLPSPWDKLNSISLHDLDLIVTFPKDKSAGRTIGITVSPNINLGFAQVNSFSLTYETATKKVMFDPIDITLFNEKLDGSWDVTDPNAAPKVPGVGTQMLDLKFIGVGQRIAPTIPLPNNIYPAVEVLENSFGSQTHAGPSSDSPLHGTQLVFSDSTEWLIAARFVVAQLVDVGVIFWDPQLYGLAVTIASGPKAGIFAGLSFEILYKKINEGLGVYQLFLKLPDRIRRFNLGQVAVTLPIIKIYIYTNGDFKVDFGFPSNNDFSQSASVSLYPFVGSGGFYFGVLSSETSDQVPDIDNGSFSPVVIFGLGVLAGVGRSINAGIFQASVSLTVQGILMGVVAKFVPYVETDPDGYYFKIQGQISLVGIVDGRVSFLIISASVHIRASVGISMKIEPYAPIQMALDVSVEVAITVSIDLGLFSIDIHCHFSTHLSYPFTIDLNSGTAPWRLKDPSEDPLLRQIRRVNNEVPTMPWTPVIPTEPHAFQLCFVPQYSAAYDTATDSQQAQLVAMLYAESSAPPGLSQKETPGLTSYDTLIRGVFLWIIHAYYPTSSADEEDLLDFTPEYLSADLEKMINYFSQSGVFPFTDADITQFLDTYCDITLLLVPQTYQKASMSFFPMLPFLTLTTPFGTVTFDDTATYQYTPDEINRIHIELDKLAPKYTQTASREGVHQSLKGPTLSLAQFMYIDAFSAIAKAVLHRASEIVTEETNTMTIEDILDKLYKNGAFSQISGIATQLMLSGLRIPPPTNSPFGTAWQGLYVLTQQQMNASKIDFSSTPKLTLTMPSSDKPSSDTGSEVVYTLTTWDQRKIQFLEQSTIAPKATGEHLIDFIIKPKQFICPDHIFWKSDQPVQDICLFSPPLQELLARFPNLTPSYTISLQPQDSGPPVPVSDFKMATVFEIVIHPATTPKGSITPDAYDIHEVSGNSVAALEALLAFHGENPTLDFIESLQILYPDKPYGDGDAQVPSGLQSDGISDTQTFILQSNFSTLSTSGIHSEHIMTPTYPNLVGMSAVEMVRYLWQSSVVNTGGYTLFYENTTEKKSFPDYLFDSARPAKIYILLTYTGLDSKLYPFMSCVIPAQSIDFKSDQLMVGMAIGSATEYDDRTMVKSALVPPGNVGFVVTQSQMPTAVKKPGKAVNKCR